MKSVSIVTITQAERIPFLNNLVLIIKNQDYPILEWVIVDGNKTIENQTILEKYIETIKGINIIYIKTKPGCQIGRLRNIGNSKVSGDIIVCMDDDDYYPKTRVSHAVEMFEKNPDKNVAGVDPVLIYDMDLDTMFQYNKINPNQSCNHAFAYRREYLDCHVYDENIHHAEEPGFLCNYLEPLIQLDPEKTVVHMSHNINTYNEKSKLFYENISLPTQNQYIKMLDKKLSEFIPEPEILAGFQSVMCRDITESEYDIVYYTGTNSIVWDPRNQGLGGSEQAVVELCRHWAMSGKKIAVYGNFNYDYNTKVTRYQNVDYYKAGCFSVLKKYKVLILWRYFGMVATFKFNKIICDKLFIDLHDNSPESYILIHNNLDKIDGVFFKSNFHHLCVEKMANVVIPKEKSLIIPNGLRVSSFIENKDNVQRDPYRLCYCSCYTRGLIPLLQHCFPIIKKLEPRAEFHIYYGMNGLDESLKLNLTLLMGQPGVCDHGRQPVDIIAREKWRSSFQLYYTSSLAEIDCISIRECILTGCLPIISKYNLFSERSGIVYHGDPEKIESYKELAYMIVELMKNPDEIHRLSNEFKKMTGLAASWQTTADKWLEALL